ncbi:hypothetical protein Tco_0691462 [Tanacetum coccineum]
MTMINKCLTRKATTYDRPRLPMLQVIWGIVIGENIDFAKLIWEDFRFQMIPEKASFHHVTKLDLVLGNLKLTNKGAKDPVFGMDVPVVMLNDEIKASADYSEYLTKSKGGKPKGRVKGLVTNKGVEVVVEKIATVRVPKKKRIATIIEQSGQSEGVEDDAEAEETEEEDEIPLVR